MREPSADWDWGRARGVFPSLGDIVRMDTSRVGPVALPAAFVSRAALNAELRAGLAELLGARAGDVTLTRTVGAAMSSVLADLLATLPRRTVVVGRRWPHGTRLARERGDVTVRVAGIRGCSLSARSFADAIDDGVAVVIVEHIDPLSGALIDVAAVIAAARAAGAACVLDASLSAGAVPIDLRQTPADAVVAGLGRWLGGGGAAAFAVWSGPPPNDGGRASRLAASAQDASLPSALGGLRAVMDAGVERISARTRELGRRVLERCADAGLDVLTARDASLRAGLIVLATIQARPVARELLAAGVAVDATAGLIRLAPHWALDPAAVDRACDLLLDALMPAGPTPPRFPAYNRPIARLAAPSVPREVHHYGPAPDEFVERWPAPGGGPTVLLLHGGFWRRRYRLDTMNAVAADLRERGATVWNLEYRRLGSPAALWPTPLEDLVRAARFALHDPPAAGSGVVVIGHSAGGHLALLLGSELARRRALPRSVLARLTLVSLAGVLDIDAARGLGLSDDAAGRLLRSAGSAGDAAPIARLPLGLPSLIAHGTADETVPVSFSRDYHAAARAAGDPCELLIFDNANHIDMIDPATPAWSAIAARATAPSHS